MEHTHRANWTEEKTIARIKEVMKTLCIERMPSSSEIEKHYGNSALTNRISKTGGFYHYAQVLGFDVKDSETALGIAIENVVRLKLIELGHDAEKTPVKFPYDLLVNRRVKVDVKAGRVVTSGPSPFYTFNLEKKEPTCDFYTAATLDNNCEIKDIYVIPSSILAGKSQLSIGINKSIYDKYIDRWDLIEKLDKAFAEVEASA